MATSLGCVFCSYRRAPGVPLEAISVSKWLLIRVMHLAVPFLLGRVRNISNQQGGNMNNGVKSATTAGLLGIFLGSVGAHWWYLGDKKKAMIHVGLLAGAVVLMLIGDMILPMTMSYLTLYRMAGMLALLNGVAGIVMSANGIWGLVEGITILTQGDEGLARKGYRVAQMNGGNGYPMNGYNNMNGGQMNGGYNGMNDGQGNGMGYEWQNNRNGNQGAQGGVKQNNGRRN